MSLVINRGLKYGKFDCFNYVYGAPKENTPEEVIGTFPMEVGNGERLDVYQTPDIGYVYVMSGGKELTTEAIKHIKDEYYNSCYEWFQFDGVGEFVDFLGAWRKSGPTELYMDSNNSKYYARRRGIKLDNICEYAEGLGLEEALSLEFRKDLTKVEIKEDEIF